MTYQNIVNELYNYYTKSGGDYNNWYVGITNDIDSRLYGDHNVSRKGVWYHAEADSNDVARQVENHFLDLGMDGKGGGGKSNSNFVYTYHKTLSTKQ